MSFRVWGFVFIMSIVIYIYTIGSRVMVWGVDYMLIISVYIYIVIIIIIIIIKLLLTYTVPL